MHWMEEGLQGLRLAPIATCATRWFLAGERGQVQPLPTAPGQHRGRSQGHGRGAAGTETPRRSPTRIPLDQPRGKLTEKLRLLQLADATISGPSCAFSSSAPENYVRFRTSFSPGWMRACEWAPRPFPFSSSFASAPSGGTLSGKRVHHQWRAASHRAVWISKQQFCSQ